MKDFGEETHVARFEQDCDTCSDSFVIEIAAVEVAAAYTVRVVHYDRQLRNKYKSEMQLSIEALTVAQDSWALLGDVMLRCVRKVAETTRCLEYEWKSAGFAAGGFITSAGSISAKHIATGTIAGSAGVGGSATIIGSGGVATSGGGRSGVIASSGKVYIGEGSSMSEFYDELLQSGCTIPKPRHY